MPNLPKEIKLSPHARERLNQRKDINTRYNTQNIMRSSVKWYGKNDLIPDSALYRHCCYTTRQSKQVGYLTDGTVEIVYNRNTHIAITVLPVKDKFKPIEKFIKPELLKKENDYKMICKDCGKETEILNVDGLCKRCIKRKANMKARNKKYVRYLDLSDKEKRRIDMAIKGQAKRTNITTNNDTKIIKEKIKKAEEKIGEADFIYLLRNCGCEIPEKDLENVLYVLNNTNKIKELLLAITSDNDQQAMLDLEQALNVIERKLQHDWEFNNFREEDDKKFKEFLTWRRTLKGAIYFWKKLYQTNTLVEMQRAWDAYVQDPNDKILLSGDRIDSTMKRYQITTDSISTIYNTRRPFTRIFYATDENVAYNMFKKWMSDRNLHEDPAKTTIVELKKE